MTLCILFCVCKLQSFCLSTCTANKGSIVTVCAHISTRTHKQSPSPVVINTRTEFMFFSVWLFLAVVLPIHRVEVMLVPSVQLETHSMPWGCSLPVLHCGSWVSPASEWDQWLCERETPCSPSTAHHDKVQNVGGCSWVLRESPHEARLRLA